jgi:hypothetical protein
MSARLAFYLGLALLALGLILVRPGDLYSQGPQCRTAPVGTKSTNCASETFVSNSLAGAGVTSVGGLAGAIAIDATLAVKPGNTIALTVPVPIASGGTNATTAAAARASLQTANSVFLTITGPTTYSVTSADLGKVIFANATAGQVTVNLPAPASFGIGQLTLKKIDATSNLVQFTGTLEQGQSNLPLSLEGDAATIASDGSVWKLISPGLATLRHNPFVAEHTITTPTYNIDKTYNGYVMIVDAATAGAPVLMVLPSLSLAAFNHQTFTVVVYKFDSGANKVSIIPNAGEPLNWSSATVDLTAQYQSAALWTDGARWIVLWKNNQVTN